MAHDYLLQDCNYIHLLELQLPQQYYNVNQPHLSSTVAYEVTAAEGGGGGGAASVASEPPGNTLVSLQQPAQQHLQPSQSQHHELTKRKPTLLRGHFPMSRCEPPVPMQMANTPMLSPACSSRKRKASSHGTESAYDDDCEDSRSVRTLPDKKQNHSEIEKRRRDKMNTYITELSAMVPMCGAMARKLDKLTVLRMAVQHLRGVRRALSACPLTTKPTFLSEKELNGVILQGAHDSFILVVGCDRGRLLYVSESVKQMLNYDQSELLGQSMFDLLHPKDVAKVKEQMSSSDLSPRERFIDAKTMLPVKADLLSGATRFGPGARRSFFCRIKCKTSQEQASQSSIVKEELEPAPKMRKKQANEKKYCVVQCTGYLKSWAPVELSEGAPQDGKDDPDASNMSCLVAVGRALPDLTPQPYVPSPTPSTRHLQYVSRHAIDGKYLFVDQRVTLALGFLPQELLGTSLYEYVNGPELGAVARTHKAALVRRDPLLTPPYSFRRKDGSLALLQTHFKPFRNPWTKDVECLVANNTIVTESQTLATGDDGHAVYDVYKHKGDAEIQQLIDSQVESQKIGSAIAEEVLRRSSTDFSPELPAELLQDVVINEQGSIVDNILGVNMNSLQVLNNVPLSSVGPAVSPTNSGGDGVASGSPNATSRPVTPLGLDGNSEAAMAVIMSLLEADAGLGGPVNFSGLPWPLP